MRDFSNRGLGFAGAALPAPGFDRKAKLHETRDNANQTNTALEHKSYKETQKERTQKTSEVNSAKGYREEALLFSSAQNRAPQAAEPDRFR